METDEDNKRQKCLIVKSHDVTSRNAGARPRCVQPAVAPGAPVSACPFYDAAVKVIFANQVLA
jgi:hypothetical protein